MTDPTQTPTPDPMWRNAAQAVQACLRDQAIDLPTVHQFGPYTGLVAALYEARRTGQPNAVQTVWLRLLRHDPALVKLLSCSPLRRQYRPDMLAFVPSARPLPNSDLPERSLVVLYGPSGVGKSFIALDMVTRIAINTTVVYIAAEGESGYGKRLQAIAQHRQLPLHDLHLLFDTSAINLSSGSDLDLFMASIRVLQPRLIVVDTLARTMDGDENSARDMSAFIRHCDHLRTELGTTVLIVHHTGKKGSNERGSSALRGAADMMIEVRDRDDVLEIACTKAKDAAGFPTRYVRLQEVTLPTQETSCVLVPSRRNTRTNTKRLRESERQILEVLSMSIFFAAGAKSSALKDMLSLQVSTIYGVLSKLKTAGLIKQSKKGDPYFITEAGLKLVQALHTEEDPFEL